MIEGDLGLMPPPEMGYKRTDAFGARDRAWLEPGA
jgi:hypothetical protein